MFLALEGWYVRTLERSSGERRASERSSVSPLAHDEDVISQDTELVAPAETTEDWWAGIPPALLPDETQLVTEDATLVDNIFSEKQQRLLTACMARGTSRVRSARFWRWRMSGCSMRWRKRRWCRTCC